ncbi:carbohydrate kinase family protein [Derxia gummosa]|uniref:Carbohydrate kinase family protein n=1 Tax=Derxia gummosa DSM 723 TaxID=1121388 RepID=A0A8B6X268_9BURK|nr:carbohydrate kinase family protein [Derxia gummosa]
MSTLICGSVAFDTIMVFPGEFKEHILPDQVHILNVAFLVPEMRREFGGTAGNIAYNLNMLGGKPIVMATVGQDSDVYLERLRNLGLDTHCLKRIPSAYTAQAFITTDRADNQITAFHPGAMNHAHENHVADAGPGVEIGIIAPDGRDGMFQHAQEMHDAGIRVVFDPGQGLPMFNGEELLHFISLAEVVAVNDYEARLMCERIGKPLEEVVKLAPVFVVTRGGAGSEIYVRGEKIEIPCVKAERIVDPTGCGDAYRAGLLFGMQRGLDWAITGRIAAILGARKIAHRGAQNHHFTTADVRSQFAAEFGSAQW